MEPVPANAIDHGDLILIPVRVVDTDISPDGHVRITYQPVDADSDNLRSSIRAHLSTAYMVAEPDGEPDAYLFRLTDGTF